MSQRINRFPIHSNQGRDDDAQGDDDQHHEILHATNDEEVQPERVHPVRLVAVAAHCLTFGETEVERELQPDNPTDEARYKCKQSNLAPYHLEDIATLGPEAPHDADVLRPLAYLKPVGAEGSQHNIQ